GGGELQLEEQVFGGGATAESEGVVTHAETDADVAAGKDAAEVVGGMGAEAAAGEGEVGIDAEALHVGRLGQRAGADADRHGDAVGGEVGLLHIEADAVGELDQGEVEILDVFA